MSFAVGALPHSGWEQAIPLLNSLGWVQNSEISAENWLQNDEGVNQVLVLHRRPEYIIAKAIEQGNTPAQAFQQWYQHAVQLLVWLRQNRRRAILVEMDALLAHNINLQPLCERLDVRAPEKVILSLPTVKSIHLLYALQMVRQSNECQILLAELEASTLPLASTSFTAPVVDIDTLAGQLEADSIALKAQEQKSKNQLEQSQQELKKLEHEASVQKQHSQVLKQQFDEGLEKKKKEASLVLEQLHLVQEELETVFSREKQLTEQSATLTQQVKTAEEQTDNIQKDLDAEKKHAANLKKNLDAVEQNFNTAKNEIATLKASSAQEKSQYQTLVKSNKQTEKQLQSTEQENSLLLKQLHLVQEELEKLFSQKRQLHQEVDNSDAALAVANNQIARLQNELNDIKSSRFYKLLQVAQPKQKSNQGYDKRKLRRNVQKLKSTRLFDAHWYLQTYPDVAESKIDPARHYLRFGAAEGRNPSLEFNTEWYLQVNSDVAESGINPLIHYIEHGISEGRAPSPEQQFYLPGPKVGV